MYRVGHFSAAVAISSDCQHTVRCRIFLLPQWQRQRGILPSALLLPFQEYSLWHFNQNIPGIVKQHYAE
jgi:hypothetical protein